MGYCSLEEAWGEDYASENSNSNYVINNIEPMTDIRSPPTTYNNIAQGIEVPKNIVPVMLNQNNIPNHMISNDSNIIYQTQLQQQQQQQHSQSAPVNNNNISIQSLYQMVNDLRKENYELKLQLKNKFNINFDNLPEIFLYGILVFLVLDVVFGFKRK